MRISFSLSFDIERDHPPAREVDMGSFVEGAEHPIGFRANVESDDGRYERDES